MQKWMKRKIIDNYISLTKKKENNIFEVVQHDFKDSKNYCYWRKVLSVLSLKLKIFSKLELKLSDQCIGQRDTRVTVTDIEHDVKSWSEWLLCYKESSESKLGERWSAVKDYQNGLASSYDHTRTEFRGRYWNKETKSKRLVIQD